MINLCDYEFLFLQMFLQPLGIVVLIENLVMF